MVGRKGFRLDGRSGMMGRGGVRSWDEVVRVRGFTGFSLRNGGPGARRVVLAKTVIVGGSGMDGWFWII